MHEENVKKWQILETLKYLVTKYSISLKLSWMHHLYDAEKILHLYRNPLTLVIRFRCVKGNKHIFVSNIFPAYTFIPSNTNAYTAILRFQPIYIYCMPYKFQEFQKCNSVNTYILKPCTQSHSFAPLLHRWIHAYIFTYIANGI